MWAILFIASNQGLVVVQDFSTLGEQSTTAVVEMFTGKYGPMTPFCNPWPVPKDNTK